ncbi:MAG: YIP1 family protein [Dehalococcoidia bacterium]|nr:YIP1 family protein [Dehalococcoidia bacterium]
MTQTPQPPAAPAPAQPAGPHPPIASPSLTFWQAAWGVVVHPQATLAHVCRERKISWGVWLLVFFSLSGALAAWVIPQPEMERILLLSGHQFRNIFGPVVLVATPLNFLPAAFGYHVIARWFKAQGTFRSLFAGYMMAGVPGVLIVPFQFLPLVAGQTGSVAATIVSAGIIMWVTILDFLAVKVNYNLTTGKAIAIFLIFWLILIGRLVIVLSIIITIFVLMAFGTVE